MASSVSPHKKKPRKSPLLSTPASSPFRVTAEMLDHLDFYPFLSPGKSDHAGHVIRHVAGHVAGQIEHNEQVSGEIQFTHEEEMSLIAMFSSPNGTPATSAKGTPVRRQLPQAFVFEKNVDEDRFQRLEARVRNLEQAIEAAAFADRPNEPVTQSVPAQNEPLDLLETQPEPEPDTEPFTVPETQPESDFGYDSVPETEPETSVPETEPETSVPETEPETVPETSVPEPVPETGQTESDCRHGPESQVAHTAPPIAPSIAPTEPLGSLDFEPRHGTPVGERVGTHNEKTRRRRKKRVTETKHCFACTLEIRRGKNGYLNIRRRTINGLERELCNFCFGHMQRVIFPQDFKKANYQNKNEGIPITLPEDISVDRLHELMKAAHSKRPDGHRRGSRSALPGRLSGQGGGATPSCQPKKKWNKLQGMPITEALKAKILDIYTANERDKLELTWKEIGGRALEAIYPDEFKLDRDPLKQTSLGHNTHWFVKQHFSDENDENEWVQTCLASPCE